ncbi:hypothetical protein A2U01_0026506 [Trifolium medium]|uniref:Uncharacterized protein n=1 Tax=Trifolium medium TaxID=97028 RepID=A0A392P081_9FABA|nr:hypothetical protein [Trifolium medium]
MQLLADTMNTAVVEVVNCGGDKKQLSLFLHDKELRLPLITVRPPPVSPPVPTSSQ